MNYVLFSILFGFVIEPALLHGNILGTILRAVLSAVIIGFIYGIMKHESFRKVCAETGKKFLAWLGKVLFGGYGAGVSMVIWSVVLFIVGVFGVPRGETPSGLQELALYLYCFLLFIGIGAITWKKVME